MEEITLRELIEILLKQKKLIVIIAIITIVASGVFSFVVLEPIYEAKAILMASNIPKNQTTASDANGVEELLDKMGQYPQMSIETYKEQINNAHILDQTIKELNLDKKDINRVQLKNMITLGTIKDTNLITIIIKNTDKKIATDIANTIAKKFTIFVSESAKEQANKSSIYIRQQMDIEKKNLDDALIEYKEYLSQPKGLTELQKEIESKIELVTRFKTDLINAEVEVEASKAAIAAGEKELSKSSDKIVLKKALIDDAYMTDLFEEKIKDSASTYNLQIESEEVNEAYSILKQNIDIIKLELAKIQSKKVNLQKEITSTQIDLEGLQASLAEKEYEDNIIKQKVNFTQSTYEAFLKKYEETRILKSSDIGDSSIIVVSPAVEPLEPVAPKKMLNIAIAAVLGLMLGVFAAFFMEYWKSSGSTKSKPNISIE